MGEGARTSAAERFLLKHRKWLLEEARKCVNPSLLESLGADVKIAVDGGGDGVSITLVWKTGASKHEQRLEPFSIEWLSDIDGDFFGNDCDVSPF